jgi:hypothetical protein
MSSDCLVLKIEEIFDGKLDTTIFVLYDSNSMEFCLYGKRSDLIGKDPSVPYSFKCKYADDLADFISFVMCKKSKWNYTLYNYNNLPEFADDITYDYLKDLDNDQSYELTGYDFNNFNRKTLLKSLRMLRNVFNYY